MTEPTAGTQCAEIMAYIRRHGSITPGDALDACGCMRLAARIQDLEADGWKFRVEMVEQNGKRFARYSLVVPDHVLEQAGQLMIFPVSERLELQMPAPPDVGANSRLHWSRRKRLRDNYWAALDIRQVSNLIPPPPRVPFERVRISARFYLWNTMDQDNLVGRFKLAGDYLVTRGYLKDDSPDVIERLEVTQVIDRQQTRLVLVIDAL